jgi:hypothetical protein
MQSEIALDEMTLRRARHQSSKAEFYTQLSFLVRRQKCEELGFFFC